MSQLNAVLHKRPDLACPEGLLSNSRRGPVGTDVLTPALPHALLSLAQLVLESETKEVLGQLLKIKLMCLKLPKGSPWPLEENPNSLAWLPSHSSFPPVPANQNAHASWASQALSIHRPLHVLLHPPRMLFTIPSPLLAHLNVASSERPLLTTPFK